MTILTHFLPDGHWSSYFDWGYRPVGHKWMTGSDWADLHRGTPSNSGGIEIPIQLVSRHHYDDPFQQEFSDTDSEDDYYNMNNNSGRVRRRRRQTPSSTKRLISPSDFQLDCELVDDKSVDTCSKSKQAYKYKSTSGLSGKLEDSHPCHMKRNSSDKNVIWLCDSDTENDINETSNYSVYKYLKTLLSTSGRQIDCMKGDGNCFFRALSKVVFASQSYYREMRKAVVDLMEKFPKKFEAFTDGPVSVHISEMKLDKTWATQAEIYAAATLLNRDIYILSPDQSGDKYRWLLFSPQFKYSSDLPHCSCYITLCHTHGNHYDRVAPITGKCNCDLEPPELSGVRETLDLTDENEVV